VAQVPHLSAKTAAERESAARLALRGATGEAASGGKDLLLRLHIAMRVALSTLTIGLGDPASALETNSKPNHCSCRLSATPR
jgi:hypothetical protein